MSSWFRKVFHKGSGSSGGGGGGGPVDDAITAATVAAASMALPTATGGVARPPLPPKPTHRQNTSQSAAASGSHASLPYVADPRAGLVETLMLDYQRLSADGATAKLQQLLELMMPPHIATTGHAFLHHTPAAGSSLPVVAPRHPGHASSSSIPALPSDVGPGLSDEAMKRNIHLIGFLASAGSRLADRIGALTGSVGAGPSGGRGSIGSSTPMGAAIADKQAARWLQLLALFSPFPQGTSDPYGARLLELLRLLACKDEKRIGCLNICRLSTVLLQCVHAIAELHPTTLEHMLTLERGADATVDADPAPARTHGRDRLVRAVSSGRKKLRRHSSSDGSPSRGSESQSELVSSQRDDAGSDDGSDFELEAVEPIEDAAAMATPASRAAESTAASPASSSPGGVLSHRSHARTATEYAKIPLVDRLCHFQSLLCSFLSSLAHAIPTTMELVRSNSLVMLVKMCVGGNVQATQALQAVDERGNPVNVNGGALYAAPTARRTSDVPPPRQQRKKHHHHQPWAHRQQRDRTGSEPAATDGSSSSSSSSDSETDDAEDADPHSVPHLLHHAQILSLSLLLKLLTSRPCLDVKVCVYLSKSNTLRMLLSLLRPSGLRVHRPSTILDLISSLVAILADSSQAQREGTTISWNLADEFGALAGYDLLLGVMLWIRTLTLQAESERVRAKPIADRWTNEDLAECTDNPFLNANSLYPVLPASAEKAYERLTPDQRCVDLRAGLSRMLELLHQLIFISAHPLKLPSADAIPDRTRLLLKSPEEIEDDPMQHMHHGHAGGGGVAGSGVGAVEEMRVKNLDAIKVVLFVFVKCPLVSVRQEILNRMLLIYSAHTDNLWLLHQLHPITYFIEMIPHLTEPRQPPDIQTKPTTTGPLGAEEATVNQPPAASPTASAASGSGSASAGTTSSGPHLQKLIWRLLEYIVNVSNVVPFQEITTIGLIMRVRSPKEIAPPPLPPPHANRSASFDRPRSGSQLLGPHGASSSSMSPAIQSTRRSSLLSFESHPSTKNLAALRTLLQFQEGHQGYPDDACVRIVLTKVGEFIEETSLFRDIFRETELFAILVQHVGQLGAYLEAKEERRKEVERQTAAAAGSGGDAEAGPGGPSVAYVPNEKLEEALRLRPLFLSLSTYQLALRTLQMLLTGSPVNLRTFREFGGSTALFGLLRFPAYRPCALELIGSQLDAGNFQEILEALQACHHDPVLQVSLLGTLIRMLSLCPPAASYTASSSSFRSDSSIESFVLPPPASTSSSGGSSVGRASIIASTMSPAVLHASYAAAGRIKDMYRSLAGFEAIFSLLSRMEGTFTTTAAASAAAGDDQPKQRNEHQWRLLEGILCIIGLSISGHTRNRAYVWSYSGKSFTWKAMAYAIQLSGVLQTEYAPRVIQCVMNLATETPQVPSVTEEAGGAAAHPMAHNGMATEKQPWCLLYPLVLDESVASSASSAPKIPARSPTIWPTVHSPDALLALLRILADCRLDLQVSGLTAIHSLLTLAAHPHSAGPSLRNLQECSRAGVLEYVLNKFGGLLDLRTGAEEEATVKAREEEATALVATYLTIPTTGLALLSHAQVVRLLQQRSFLCQSIVEGIATLRITTVELKQLVMQFHANERWTDDATTTVVPTSATSAKVSPSLALYQFLLRLHHRSCWSSSASAGAFLEFDLRTHGYACMDIPNFGGQRATWPVSGVFACAMWINVRSFRNEPPNAGGGGGGGAAAGAGGMAMPPMSRVTSTGGSRIVSPLLQLFEFTSGEHHLWSACLLPTGRLLVSAGFVSSRSSGLTTTTPWRSVNLDSLDEKGPGQGQAIFDKFLLIPQKWTHLALLHEKAKGQNRLLLSLYVDGAFVQQVQVQCAPTMNTSGVMAARGYIGVPPPTPATSAAGAASAGHPSPSNLVWWLNNLYFLSSLLTPSEISLMYRRGPGYQGSFLPNSSAGGKSAAGVLHGTLVRTPASNGTVKGTLSANATSAGATGVSSASAPSPTNVPLTARGGPASSGGGVTEPAPLSSPFRSAAERSAARRASMLSNDFDAVVLASLGSVEKATPFERALLKQREHLKARCAAMHAQPEDPMLVAGGVNGIPGSMPSTPMGIMTPSASGGSSTNTAHSGAAPDSNFFDGEKVLFAFAAHHVWSLREQYAAETSAAASGSAGASSSSGGSKSTQAAVEDESHLRTVIAYAESHDPGQVLPNMTAASSSQLSKLGQPVVYLSGGACAIQPIGLVQELRRVGGVAALIALVDGDEVKTSDDVLLLLTLLVGMLQVEENLRDMARIGGYTLLACALQGKRALLTGDILHLLSSLIDGTSPHHSLVLAQKAGLLQVGTPALKSMLPASLRMLDSMDTTILDVVSPPYLCCEEHSGHTYFWLVSCEPTLEVPEDVTLVAGKVGVKPILANALALEQLLLNANVWGECDQSIQDELLVAAASFSLVEPRSEALATAFQTSQTRQYAPREFEAGARGLLRESVAALQKQSILFNWTSELLMVEPADTPLIGETDVLHRRWAVTRQSAADPSGLDSSSTPTAGGALHSSFTSCPSASSRVLSSSIPLPCRGPTQSMHILTEWIRRGFLPSQRYQLDMTEGPLRQRKKMAVQEDFYLHYKVHLPRLAKALPILETKHQGVSEAAQETTNDPTSRPDTPTATSTEQDGEPTTTQSFSEDSLFPLAREASLGLPSPDASAASAAASGDKASRRTGTLDADSFAQMKECAEKLGVSEDARRQLLEELPQLPMATLTQITAHAAQVAHDAEAASASGYKRRSRRGSRRQSTVSLTIQHSGEDASSSAAAAALAAGVDMSPIVESPFSGAASPVSESMLVGVGSLGVEPSPIDSESESESDDEPAIDTPTKRKSSVESSGQSSSADSTPMRRSDQALEKPMAVDTMLEPITADPTLAASPTDGLSLSARRDALTRARSVTQAASRSVTSPAPSPVKAPAATTNLPTHSRPASVSSAAAFASPLDDSSQSVELDEYEKILQMLEPGDDVINGGLYACSRVTGLDKVTAVALLCTHHLYVIDHFGFSADGILTSIDPSLPSGLPGTDEPLFTVEVTARPVSAPWTSEDGDSRQRKEAEAVAAAEPIPPLAPTDVVLRVSKVTKSSPDDLSQLYKKKKQPRKASDPPERHISTSTLLSRPLPADDPEDPLLATIGETHRPSVHKISYSSLRELQKRRYSLMALGLEFFCYDGVTLLLVFDTPDQRDEIHAKVLQVTASETDRAVGPGVGYAHATAHMLDLSLTLHGPGLTIPSFARLRAWRKGVCEKWQRGDISNFAYLMYLNHFAGRSYNDFTQYPVFPWILNDYTSQTLALDDEKVYRDLSKPMGAIGHERAKLFQQRYAQWEDPAGLIPSFHYGTHYSSSATVLYYLLRLEPFTQYNLHLQGGKFDHADRLFFDLEHTWTSASSQGGLSDVKELIPEFFFLPDFLSNSNRFDLGEHQRGGYVGDVKLPPWACGDPRIFIRLHRRALESAHVSAHLHEWIDLIFGHKQQGKAAVKAQNVFYYLTYEDVVDVNAIADPLEKQAIVSQISNFGQTPHQIFKHAHPSRRVGENGQRVSISSHPQLLHPVQASNPTILARRVAALHYSGKQERLFALDADKAIVPGSFTKYLSWNHSDLSLRFHILQTSPRHRVLDEVVAVHEGMHDGQITMATASEDGQCIMTGGEDGVVKVWRLHPEHKHKQALLTRSLPGHWAPITAIAHAVSYSLLITAGEDGQVLFYDMNRLSLQHKLPIHPLPVRCIAIDADRGDVITCAGPNIYVWTVNGELVAEHLGSVAPSETIESVVWSTGPEGAWAEPNVITGHRDGSIRIWSLMYPSAAGAVNGSSDTAAAASSTLPSATTQSGRTHSFSTMPPSAAAAATSSDGRSRFDSLRTDVLATPRGAGPPLSSAAARASGSLGTGFLTIDQCHRLESVHECAVTALHTSHSDWRKFWSGDKSGRVQAWQISSEEHWLKDAEAKNCQACQVKFTVLERRHHCRECGSVFCSKCSSHRTPLEHLGFSQPVRVCDTCYQKMRNNPITSPTSIHARTASTMGSQTAR